MMFEKTPVKGIIFDLDGTLVRFEIDFLNLRKELIDFLNITYDFPPNFFSLKERVLVTVEKARDFYSNNNPAGEWDGIGQNLDGIIRKYEWEGARKTELLPTVHKTLHSLRQKDLKLGLFTLEPRDITIYILEEFNIKEYFDVISSRSDVEKLKPHPDHLYDIFNSFNIPPNHIIVCGDHPMDMKCAKDAGAIPIGIKNTHPRATLIGHGARTCISSLKDLLSLLKLK